MLTKPTGWDRIFALPHRVEYYVIIGERMYTDEQIVSLQVERALFDRPGIGSTAAAQLTVSLLGVDTADVPRMAIADGSALATDRYLIDASYFAIKNITLSYTLPQLWVNKIGLGAVRVFTSMDNVALFTHLDGMDPQYNFGGGTDYDYVPNKTVTVGLEVKF